MPDKTLQWKLREQVRRTSWGQKQQEDGAKLTEWVKQNEGETESEVANARVEELCETTKNKALETRVEGLCEATDRAIHFQLD